MKTVITLLMALALLLIGTQFAAAQDSSRLDGVIRLDFQENPLRKINGNIYDLTPLFNWSKLRLSGHDQASTGPRPLPEWGITVGRVMQITDDGVLLSGGSSGDRFVRNWPRARAVKDDDIVMILVCRVENYRYNSVIGAERTIAGYDYGEIPSQKEIELLKAKSAARVATEKAKADSEHADKLALAEKQTVAYLKKRSEEGSASHQHDLALRYLQGKGVEKDDKEARRLLELSAKQNFAPAIKKLDELK